MSINIEDTDTQAAAYNAMGLLQGNDEKGGYQFPLQKSRDCLEGWDL